MEGQCRAAVLVCLGVFSLGSRIYPKKVNGNRGLLGLPRMSRQLPKSTFSTEWGAKCEPENTREFFHPRQSAQSAVHPIAVFWFIPVTS